MKDNKVVKAGRELPLEESVEAFIDAFVTSGALSAIPVTGTVLGVFKAFRTYKSEKLKAKLKEFLNETSSLQRDEIGTFLLENKKDEDPLLVEHLLELVEQAESTQKAMIIGVLFRRLVRGKITRGQFTDQVRFTNQIFIIDLFHFMHGYHNQAILQDGLGDILTNHRVCKRTMKIAYMDKNFLSQEKVQYIDVSYELTEVGKVFLRSLHEAYKDRINPERQLVD
ncbi:hypothetical protein [Pseudomonas sp. K5002]|uniref:hypothetical protein n=1 Tax=Pseudomonas sp. K5002 TaxID=2738828 RepID=UPI0015BF3A6D|nr:hypothetical protein [Pseudomonas sp. K5002]NWD88232.1 hypothetical protein [Pseudomonas sp. K5002]